MKMALGLALNGLGRTSPNPCVGALLVKGGRVVGHGFHLKSGKDHAEFIAIKNAGQKARGAVLYVTLEPCCHYGKTPPCTDAIIKAGIKKVVISVSKDPNPSVCGKGVKILRKAGIDVVCGICEDEGRFLIQPYLKSRVSNLPYVVLKTACTFDFKITDKNGKSKWITSKESRMFSRNLRSHSDAILTGGGTVLADDPMLSAKNRPLRVILDSGLRTPLSAKVLRDKNVLFVTTDSANVGKFKKFEIFNAGKKINIKKVLLELARRGIRSVFVEAGNALNTSFVKAGVVDKFYIFVAPKIFNGGLDAFSTPVPKFKLVQTRKISDDILFEGYANLY